MSKNDPNEWAARRKAAVERAKQIKEERKNSIGQGDTFAPQLVSRRGSNSSNIKHPDALDRLTNEVAVPSNDIMEQPLAAQRNKNQPSHFSNNTDFSNGLPSPNSDSLGKEIKKFGGNAPTNNESNTQSQYKSKFLQQYEQAPSNKREKSNANANATGEGMKKPNEDEEFMTMLRSDARSSGPGWNNDTATDGTFAPPRRSNNAASRTTQAKAARLPAEDHGREVNLQDFRGGFPNSSRSNNSDGSRIISDNNYPYDESSTTVRNRHGSGAGNGMMISPRVAGGGDPKGQIVMTRSAGGDPVISQARSNLSLLKNKIRQSESFNSTRSLRKTASASEMDDDQLGTAHSDSSSTKKSYEPYVPNSRNTNPVARNSQQSVVPTGRSQYNNSNSNNNSYHSNSNSNGYGKNNNNNNNFEEDEEEEVEVVVPRNRRQPSNGIASNPPRQMQPPPQQQQQQQQYSYAPYDPSAAKNRPPSGSRQNPPPDYYPPDQSSYNPNISKPPVRNVPPAASRNPAPQPQPVDDDDDDDDEYNAQGNPFGNEQEEALDENAEQLQCPDCGRKFNPIPYSRHVKICAKVFMKKRKAFDSAKMRIQDNPELVQIIAKTKKEEMKQAKLQNKKAGAGAAAAAGQDRPLDNGGGANPKWKNQSQAFREAMRAARECAKAQAAGAPLPPPMPSAPDPSLIPCPHCGRRFNEKAAERHIPQCQNIKAKPSSLKRGGGLGASSGITKVKK